MTGSPPKIVLIICAYNKEVPRSFKAKIRDLGQRLKNEGYEVQEHISYEDGKPSDIHICVSDGKCDLVVAVCDYGSTELGIWIGLRLKEGEPLLLAAFLAGSTTQLVIDIERAGYCVRTTYAANVDEMVKSVIDCLYPPARHGSPPEVPKFKDEGAQEVA